MKNMHHAMLVLLLCSMTAHGFFGFGSNNQKEQWDLGLDLGTRTSVLVRSVAGNVEVIAKDYSAVCYDPRTNHVQCIGAEAIRKIGKCPPPLLALRPLEDGTVKEVLPTALYLSGLFQHGNVPINPVDPSKSIADISIVVGVPCTFKDGDRLSIKECMEGLGITRVSMVKEPIAAAIEAGVDIASDTVSLIVDIGGGTTDIIALTQNSALAQKAVNVAGDKMDAAIVNFVRKEHKLQIDPETAERVKREIGAVWTDGSEDSNAKMKVSGMDVIESVPRTILLSRNEIVIALNGCAQSILTAVHDVVQELAARAGGDIAEGGIVLTGGGALVPGMKELLEQRFKLHVTIPADPLLAVGKGIGKILADPTKYNSVLQDVRMSAW